MVISFNLRSSAGLEPTSGNVYVFVGKSRRIMKLLHWERGGYVMYDKRRWNQALAYVPSRLSKICLSLYFDIFTRIERFMFSMKDITQLI